MKSGAATSTVSLREEVKQSKPQGSLANKQKHDGAFQQTIDQIKDFTAPAGSVEAPAARLEPDSSEPPDPWQLPAPCAALAGLSRPEEEHFDLALLFLLGAFEVVVDVAGFAGVGLCRAIAVGAGWGGDWLLGC